MDLALTLAIFERLAGVPLDSQGRPVLDADGVPSNRHNSAGVRIPFRNTALPPARSSLATDNPGGLRVWGRGFEEAVYSQVLVQVDGTDGKRFDEVWPCVTIVETDLLQGSDPYLYYDPICEGRGTATITHPITGEVVTGADQMRERRHPDPYNAVYTIGAFSRSTVERALLVRSILYILGPKGAISVENPDGTFRMVDYVHERTAMVNQGEAYNPKRGTAPSEPLHLAAHLTYIFETHLDNSADGYGTHDWSSWEDTVTQRILEIQSIQGDIWEGRLDLETVRQGQS